MIRMLLVLMLASPVEIYQHREDNEFLADSDYSVQVVIEPASIGDVFVIDKWDTTEGSYATPAVTCQCWRCICTGPDGRCWTGCCNASRAARLILNIHGMDELPDIDADLEDQPHE